MYFVHKNTLPNLHVQAGDKVHYWLYGVRNDGKVDQLTNLVSTVIGMYHVMSVIYNLEYFLSINAVYVKDSKCAASRFHELWSRAKGGREGAIGYLIL